MPVQKIYHANHFDLGQLAGAIDFEQYLENIQQKPADQRTNLERQILNLYQKAEAKGTAFCMEQIKNKIQQTYAENPILFFAGAAVLGYFIIKTLK